MRRIPGLTVLKFGQARELGELLGGKKRVPLLVDHQFWVIFLSC